MGGRWSSRTLPGPACLFAAQGHRKSGRWEKSVTTAIFTKQQVDFKTHIFSPHEVIDKMENIFKASFGNIFRKEQKQSPKADRSHNQPTPQ